ncbi:MAG: DUF4349 domain-containing protein [Clostridia bacterium]|nr:DUF4349 domain-containing protein [Clostridia bacterium]
MTCKETEELLSAYIDNVLDQDSERQIAEHLAGCKNCQAELEGLQMTVDVLKQLPEVEPPSHFRQELLKKLAAENKKVVEISNNSSKAKSKSWISVAGVAAGMLLLVAAGQVAGQLGLLDIGSLRIMDSAGLGSKGEEMATSNYARDEAYPYLESAPAPSAPKISAADGRTGIDTSNQSTVGMALTSESKAMGEQKNPAQGDLGQLGVLTEETSSYERKIMKDAYLSMEVGQYQAVVRQVEELAVSLGGYIQDSSHIVSQQGNYSGQMVIRVPQQNFELAVSQIEELGSQKSRRLAGRDVTMEYYDVEGRLKVAREKEGRLLDLLKKADRLEDIINIERELGYTRNEIEHLTGQIRYLNQMTGLATINLNLTEPVIKTEMITAPGISGIFQRSGEAFIVTTNRMLNLLGELVVLGGASLPVIIILGILVAVVIFVRRKS